MVWIISGGILAVVIAFYYEQDKKDREAARPNGTQYLPRAMRNRKRSGWRCCGRMQWGAYCARCKWPPRSGRLRAEWLPRSKRSNRSCLGSQTAVGVGWASRKGPAVATR
jgi:hypothetical protein